MKKHLKNTLYNNWSFIITCIFIQLKSMIILSMLRTENSSSISLTSIYFTKPFILGHFLIIISFFSIIFLFKPKSRFKVSILINLLISILFVLDIFYYRSNGAFLSYKHLLHPEIFNPTNSNLFNFRIVDLLFIIDFIPLILINRFISKLKINKSYNEKLYFRIIKTALIFISSISLISIYHTKIDITKEITGINFFSLSWAPFQTYSDMSPLGYHFYDIAYFNNKEKDLSIEEEKEIAQWLEINKEDLPDNKFKGLLKGKNIIALQVESLENFVINQKVYGQEITPNLNKLLKSSIYFNNIYEQNNSGTSSDADLMVNTSIFPVRSLSTFPTYPWVKYNTLQNLLEKNNYNSLSTHAEAAGNWNWAENHKSFGTDKILDISNYNVDEVIGLGLSDESYLKQVANKITALDLPFYTFVTTLTSHGPFNMPDDKKYLDIPEDLDNTILGAYFQSIRYTD
ncbi:LTA synthase family protein, partial [Clostridium sp.]|uniref:LTA synthase family protein n=1 Tax=Clostridium sp. TaxID=1506 RepID=UPI00261789A3